MQLWYGTGVQHMKKLDLSEYSMKQPELLGLTRSVSTGKLVKEIGWLSLLNSLLFQKAVFTYKIINGLAPNYISNIMPPFVSERTEYSLRNADDISV